KLIGTLVLPVVLTLSCQKNEADALADYRDQYRFYFKAQIDDETVNINAGQDGYILFTDYYFYDGVVSMVGRLEKGGGDKRNSLEIVLRSRDLLDAPSMFSEGASISEGVYPYRDRNGRSEINGMYDISFEPVVEGGGASFLWTF